MVHPKYSPEEALERVKLMMKYDTSKTLNENKEIIFEQSSSCPNSITYDVLIKKSNDAGNIVKAMDSTFIRMLDSEKRAINLYNIVKSLVGANVLDDLTGECISAMDKFKEVFKSSGSRGIFSGGFDLVEKLNEFINGYYSDEEQVKRYLNVTLRLLNNEKITYTPSANVSSTQPAASANTAANTTKGQETRQQNINNIYCSVDFSTGIIKNEYSQMNGKNWYSWVKAQNVTNEEIDTAKKSCPKTGGSSAPKRKYTQCDGTYKVNYCKSEVIRKVQACLGMPAKYQTGNFGPITKGELSKKFPQFKDSFTDDDVYEIICKKTSLKDAGLQTVNTTDKPFAPDLQGSNAKITGSPQIGSNQKDLAAN